MAKKKEPADQETQVPNESADQETQVPSESVTDKVGPAPMIPRYSQENPAAFYEGRDRAVILLLKGEQIATADWATIVHGGGVATKPGYDNSVYELTPTGLKGLSNKHRAEILKLNQGNHAHNVAEFEKQAPTIAAYLIQNKDVAVRILNEGVRAFQGANPVDKTVAKPMHAAFDRVTVGEMDSIAGLQVTIWNELQKETYKTNGAAQEITKAAEGARKTFDERRDKYDQFVRIRTTLELTAQVLEGTKLFRSLSPADKRLLTIKVDGVARNIVKKVGANKPELTEPGREWAIEIQTRSSNLKSEATLIIDQSAKNSRDNARAAEKAAEQTSTAPSVPSI